MAWTDDRVEILTKLWGEGLSASQIARELGDVTRNAVIGKVHRLGLAGRASPTRPKSRIRHREPSNFSSNFDTKDRFSERPEIDTGKMLSTDAIEHDEPEGRS